jgi:hypothetical protein
VNCAGDECVGLLKDFYVFHFCLSLGGQTVLRLV